MIVKVPNSPSTRPSLRYAVDGPRLMAYRLDLELGGEEGIELWIPPNVESMKWVESILREAADRLEAAADALSRQENETRAKEAE